MTRLEEFHLDFTQIIISDADSRGLMRTQAFVEKACEILSESGDLSADYAAAEYIKDTAEAYGYDYDVKNNILTLLSVLFFQEEEIRILTKPLLSSKFTKLKNFFRFCAGGGYSQLEETSDAYDMAYNIYKYLHQRKTEKVRLLLVTDGRLAKKTEVPPNETIYEVPIEFQIIDIEYLHDIHLTETGNASFEIQVNLPYLPVNGGGDPYQSYLTVITGDQLADIYGTHNKRLFEQNVRTFLQFKGGVNKGLKNTIQHHPEMFFAYNNGITATAAAVETGPDGNIHTIKNLQIVNGGQTVSAIYAASKKGGADVSKVAVQMKLSIVKDPEQHDGFVSKVAEYANTQNKINASDFFSNHPFHKEIKVFSANTIAPAVNGSQRRTRWYYERVRGEYLNSQAYLEQAEKKKFQQDYPKGQVIDKTLLSKTENVWLCLPYIVAKGAQYSFKAYSDYIIEQTEKDPLFVNETFFKHAAARVILFRSVERLITASDWYDGGYRAQTAAYTISKLSDFLAKKGYRLNFDLIWETQAVPQTLILLLEEISKKTYDTITQPVEGRANAAQYAKTKECWANIQKIELAFDNWDPAVFIKGSGPAAALPAAAAGNMDVKAFVSKKRTSDWMQLADSYDDDPSQSLSSRQRTILTKMALGQITDPTAAECQILYDLYTALNKL